MLFNDWLNMKLKEVGKTWHDFTKAGIGGQTMYNIQHGKYRTLKDGTCQKLALVLGLCKGDIRDAIAQSVKEEDAGKETKPTIHEIDAYMEEEGLPFSDLETEERQEEPDVKWYKDRLKEDAPEKVKVKEEVLTAPTIHIDTSFVKDIENAVRETQEQVKQAVQNAMSHMASGMPEKAKVEEEAVVEAADKDEPLAKSTNTIKACLTEEEYIGFLKSSIMCCMLYGDHDDLRSAHWYLDRLIEAVEE